MEYVGVIAVFVVFGIIGYAAWRARQEKASDANRGGTIGGPPNRDTDLR